MNMMHLLTSTTLVKCVTSSFLNDCVLEFADGSVDLCIFKWKDKSLDQYYTCEPCDKLFP